MKKNKPQNPEPKTQNLASDPQNPEPKTQNHASKIGAVMVVGGGVGGIQAALDLAEAGYFIELL